MEIDPQVHEHYRLFESPGLEHCAGGAGAYPAKHFEALVKWVETGEAPDALEAKSFPDETGDVKQRILCPYPQRAKYNGKDGPNSYESFHCTEWTH